MSLEEQVRKNTRWRQIQQVITTIILLISFFFIIYNLLEKL